MSSPLPLQSHQFFLVSIFWWNSTIFYIFYLFTRQHFHRYFVFFWWKIIPAEIYFMNFTQIHTGENLSSSKAQQTLAFRLLNVVEFEIFIQIVLIINQTVFSWTGKLFSTFSPIFTFFAFRICLLFSFKHSNLH